MRFQAVLSFIAGLKILACVVAASLGAVPLLAESLSGIPAWTYLAQVLAYTLAGTLLRVGGQHDERARDLATAYLLTASVFSGHLFLRAVSDQSSPIPSLAILLSAIKVDAFIPYAFWRFARQFPRRLALGRVEQVLSWIPRFCLVFGILFMGLGITTGISRLLGQTHIGLSVPFVRLLYWALVFLTVLSSVVYILWKSSRTSVAEQRRGRLFIVGLLLGIIPIALDTLLDILVPPYARAMDDPHVARLAGFFILPMLLSIPFTTSYSVLVHKALDVRLVVRRAMQYAMARYTLLAVVAAPFVVLAVQLVLNRNRPLTEAVWGSAAGGLTTVLLGLVAYLARRPMLQTLDRRFFREEYDAGAILAHLMARIRDAPTTAQLANLVSSEINRALHVTSAAIFLLDTVSRRFVDPRGHYPSFAESSDFVDLAGRRGFLRINSMKSGGTWRDLPAEEREWLADGGFELLVAIHDSPSGRTLGIIALGEKRSELPYSRVDIEMIRDVATSTSLVLENLVLRGSGSDRPRRWDPNRATTNPTRECTGCGSFNSSGSHTCPRCSSEMVPAILPSDLYGKFLIEGRIGRGAMGVVYKAWDTMLRRPVAIKTLPRVSPEQIYRLRREARTMAAIQHPNLAIIYDMESWSGIPLMIMEYLAGGTLKSRIASGALPIEGAVQIALTLSSTLARAHKAGILHRDVKPSNIGFDSEGTVKILDFGIAHILPMIPGAQPPHRAGGNAPLHLSSKTISLAELPTPTARSKSVSSYAIGTPLYMSPEALSHQRPHPMFDTWSLAVVLFEMIAGRHPLYEPGMHLEFDALVDPRIPELRSLRADCPESLAAFVARALSRQSAARPDTAEAFHRMLSEASGVPVA